VTTNDENISTSDTSGESKDLGATPEAVESATAVAAVTAERDQLRDQLLRTAADFDNYRKRTRKEIEEARARGREDAVKDVLPVFDNLERAVSAATSAQTIESVVEGVKMVLKLFEDTSERMGLTRVKTVGERFDPAMHEAIQQQETDDHPPGTILTEVVPGYMIGQRLLRAAMVVVSRKPSAKPAPSDAEASVSSGGATSDGSGSTHGNSA
jgi:molecular chaperone GrpE